MLNVLMSPLCFIMRLKINYTIINNDIYKNYKKDNNTDKQIETLKDILSYDENNQKSIQKLEYI